MEELDNFYIKKEGYYLVWKLLGAYHKLIDVRYDWYKFVQISEEKNHYWLEYNPKCTWENFRLIINKNATASVQYSFKGRGFFDNTSIDTFVFNTESEMLEAHKIHELMLEDCKKYKGYEFRTALNKGYEFFRRKYIDHIL